MSKFNLKPKNPNEPSKGKLLIAEPFMQDPYFKRYGCFHSVSTMMKVLWFILNRFIDLKLDEIIEDVSIAEAKVGLGGPVESSNLYYLHSLGDIIEGSLAISENIYLGGDYDQLKTKLMSAEISLDQVRFFVGYSGWGNEQLESELEEESWYVTELNGLDIMDTERDDLWGTALKEMGGDFANLVNFPADPSLN